MKAVWWLFISLFGVVNCVQTIIQDFKGFDDSILFNIVWPGDSDTSENLVKEDTDASEAKEILRVTSVNNEKYDCELPELNPKESDKIEDYTGPTPLRLLSPLFTHKICSYRLETYWSYEVCHGMYIRQYHENREDKKLHTQEYYLGLWKPEKMAELEARMKTAEESKEPLKTLKMEGLSLPYVEMLMDDGTVCDLSGKPRLTRVRYVCDTHGKHEVFSLKETATCEYEIIILSPLLCEHPKFKPKNVGEKVITCRPLEGAPKKPRSLLQLEADNIKMQYPIIKLINDQEPADVLAVLKIEKNEKDGTFNFEVHPLTERADLTEQLMEKVASEQSKPPFTDDSPVRAFLNGENCLHGGTGWWKYEFCYGKNVLQYHVDRSGERRSLLLGTFKEEDHLAWLKENPNKAPKPVEQRTSVSHFYSSGDICDKTGKPRQTEVKLKCLENSSSPAQVSLYLLEPKTCHYILGVESPLICDILPLADENGLIKNVKLNPYKREIGEDTTKAKTDNKDLEPTPNDDEAIGID